MVTAGTEDNYSSGGGTFKQRVPRTNLVFSVMILETPVFDTADKHPLPEYVTGLLVNSREIEDVHWQAAHVTAFKNQNAST
jgi:hypothetical protein